MRLCNWILGFFLFVSFALPAWSIRVEGIVIDEKGEPLPFVNVFQVGTTNGTSSNLEGKFTLEVSSLPAQIEFRFIGYQTQRITISPPLTQLSITLFPQAIEIQEVVINDTEDPAYRIIRKAQQKRNFYKNQVKQYSCNAYIKGSSRLINVPEKVLGQTITLDGLDSTRSGIVYLSESVSELFVNLPDKKEIMISSKVSGKSQGFSWNSALDFQLDFYDNMVPTPITDRDVISPIASTAFTYYRYALLGYFMEGSQIIYQIQVTPKITGSPLLNGIINIQDETWRIHSIDMFLTKDNGMNFLDTLRMNVIFNPVTPDVWLKGTQIFTFNFNLKLFNIKGDGNFTGVFSNYNLAPQFEKKFFTSEVVKINEEANQKNQQYWDSIRPIPLTKAEELDYTFKDSLEIIQKSKPYLDSVDRINNRFKPIQLLSGYSYENSYKQWEINLSSPLMNLHFNTIEGFNLSQRIEFEKYNREKRNRTVVYAQGRYGFSNQRFSFKSGFNHRFNATNRMYIKVEGGTYLTQFNETDGIPELHNSLYTIFFEENFMKAYQKSYGKLGWGAEVTNGILVEIGAEGGYRNALVNSPTLIPFYVNWDNRSFTSNDPQNATNLGLSFNPHYFLKANLHLRFRIGQKFMSRPGLKINYRSKWPQIDLYYTHSFGNIGGASPDFDFLKLHLSQEIDLGILGYSEFDVSGGWFVRKDTLYFADYQHFATTQTLFSQRRDLESFRILPYYAASTDAYFAEVHYQHHFKGWLFGKIPGIKKLKWQEVVGFHFLYTPSFNDYYEFTVGIEQIFRIIRVDFVGGFERNAAPRWGGRLKIAF